MTVHRMRRCVRCEAKFDRAYQPVLVEEGEPPSVKRWVARYWLRGLGSWWTQANEVCEPCEGTLAQRGETVFRRYEARS